MVEGCAVARMVHYTNAEGECAAAVITKVWKKETGTVNLTVFRDSHTARGEMTEIKTSVEWSHLSKRGAWHWPERA